MDCNFKIDIEEVVIVEGKDDTARLKCIEGIQTIETHGFGISKNKWIEIENAYNKKGIIIFTDPDFAGNEIRRRIKERFPNAKEAFIIKEKATKDKNIGIENVKPEDLLEALQKATKLEKRKDNIKENTRKLIKKEDLVRLELAGISKARENRKKLGDSLGFGYCNGKGLLEKLNFYNIKEEEIKEILREKETDVKRG